MREFLGGIDFRFIELHTAAEREALEAEFEDTEAWRQWEAAAADDDALTRAVSLLHKNTVSDVTGFGSGDVRHLRSVR